MLELREISCHRGDRKLFGELSLSVLPGGVLSVEGRNGSGKTTLLRALCGLTALDDGKICWQGRDITGQREQFVAQVMYLGHRNALKDDLSPMENLQASLRIAGHAITGAAARSALEAVGLGPAFHQLPTKVLSEGQKRRVALARLWCDERPLWVLDEPFTALDAHSSQLLRQRLQQHVDRKGVVVVATHQDIGLDPRVIHQLRLGE